MVSQRISLIIQKTGLQIIDFTKKAGINQSTVHDLLKHRVKNISGEIVVKIQNGLRNIWHHPLNLYLV